MRPSRHLWFAFEKERFDGPEPWFFPEADFPVLALLEENWRSIHREISALLEDDASRLKPYLQKTMSFPPGDWKTLAFYFWGLRVKANCAKCPQLDALLRRIPGLTAASISVLEPQTKIKPHYGDTNAIARIHLGLEIPGGPPDCAFQVGEEIRPWVAGRAHAFCDAHLHMAWNYTPHRRVIMILDVIRPEFRDRTTAICSRVLGSILLLSLAEVFPVLGRLPARGRNLLWGATTALMRAFLPLQRIFAR
jgi:aspartyl/asparaginyl beta-hydroxylase (cupin superfamily)